MSKRRALLVVDVQQVFYSQNEQVNAAFPQLKDNISTLLQRVRAADTAESDDTSATLAGIELVVHVRAVYKEELGSAWMPFFRALNPDKTRVPVTNVPEEFASERVREAAAGGGAGEGAGDVVREVVVEKATFDAFNGTELDALLKEAGVEEVVICGLVTSACVLMTIHGAFSRGYAPTVLEDCCGDRSQERHDAIFELYGDYFFRTATLETLDKVLATD